MDITQQLYIIEQIKQVKARYFRGVDQKDPDIISSTLAEQVMQDFSDIMHDPVSGYRPVTGMKPSVLPREKAVKNILYALKGIMTVHIGYCPEITVIDENNATGIWPFHDKVFLKEDTGYTTIQTGYGYYHSTYVHEDDGWKIASTRATRLYLDADRDKLEAHLNTLGAKY